LIKEKIVPIWQHFTHDRIEGPKPNICLLCNRRVEIPCLVTFAIKFPVHGRIAITLAVLVSDGMLAVEVKDVNCEANIGKHRVVFDMFRERAVIVKKNVIWHHPIDAECASDEFLAQRD
jgi:hypothetical protein